jgi:hypothetical protein
LALHVRLTAALSFSTEQQIRDKKERLLQEKEGAYSSVRKGAVSTSFDQSELSSAHQRRLQADGGAVLANGRADDSPPFSYQAQQAFPSSIGSPNAYNERSMPGRPQLNSSAFSPNADNGKRWSPSTSTANFNPAPDATWQNQNEPWSPVVSSQALSPQREDQIWGREQLQSVSPPKTRPFMTGVANLNGLTSADRGREDQKRQVRSLMFEKCVRFSFHSAPFPAVSSLRNGLSELASWSGFEREPRERKRQQAELC